MTESVSRFEFFMKKDDIFGGVILLIVIAAIGLFLYLAKPAPELSYGPVEITGSSIAATAPGNGEADITATLLKPGFVTIHKSIGSAPGPIIGSSGLIAASENATVTILTSEPMEDGLTYVALLHVDNGDGKLVISQDMPVTSNSVSVRADFTSSPEAK